MRRYRNTDWMAGIVVGWLLVCGGVKAAVPEALNVQGRVLVAGNPYTGTGQFKFALVDAAANVVWTSGPVGGLAEGEPDTAVSLAVARGLYSVALGDGMQALPAGLFETHGDLRLRVWFNDGTHGFQHLLPDQPLTAVAYARRSASAQAADAVTGAVDAGQLVGTVDVARLPSNVARLDSSPGFSGTVTAPAFAGQGVLPVADSSASSLTAVPNTAYMARRADGTAGFTLPTVANPGDVIRVTGIGAGGWQVDGLPAGINWTVGTANLRWSSVAASSDGLRLLAAADGGTLYHSEDGGATWQPFNALVPRAWSAVAMSADGVRLGALGTNSQIYVSLNAGASWTLRESARQWQDLACSADGSRWVAVVMNGFIYTSTDTGSTWTARESSRAWTAVASSLDGRWLIAAVSGGPLFVSGNFGGLWQSREASRNWQAVAVSLDGSRMVAAERNGRLYVSTDFGQTWSARESVRAWQSVASTADGNILVAVVKVGQVFVSTDAGATWVPRETSRSWTRVAMSSRGTRMVAVAGPGPICTSVGTLSGAAGAVGEFQYLADGGWRAVSYAMLDDSGHVPLATVPDLPAAKLTSGVLDPARIPSLDASAVASGVLDPARLPKHSADLLEGGHISDAMIPDQISGKRRFNDGVGFGTAPEGTTPITIKGDRANASFGYCLALGYYDLPTWKVGVDTSKVFSIGAAGLRDYDLAIDQDGNVGFGARPYGNMKVRVAGDLSVDGAGYADEGFWLSSDARYKTNVTTIAEPVRLLTALRGVEFTWLTKPSGKAPPAGPQLGFIAQEVAAVLPQAVRTNREGRLTVNYDAAVPVVVEAVKALNQQWTERLAAKETEIESLRARLARLEAVVERRLAADSPASVTPSAHRLAREDR